MWRHTEIVTVSLPAITQQRRANEVRYDTRCYFNVNSKADISQLNLPHGTTTKIEEKVKSKKRICSEISVNSPGLRGK